MHLCETYSRSRSLCIKDKNLYIRCSKLDLFRFRIARYIISSISSTCDSSILYFLEETNEIDTMQNKSVPSDQFCI